MLKEEKYIDIEPGLDSPEIDFVPYENLLENKSDITRKEEVFIKLCRKNWVGSSETWN